MAIDKNKIKITEKALNYLKKKEKLSVIIGYPDYRTNGDFAVVPVPEIYAKKPKVEEQYNKINIDGIDVYISKLVYMPENEVIINVDSFLKMNFLTVAGFSIKGQ